MLKLSQRLNFSEEQGCFEHFIQSKKTMTHVESFILGTYLFDLATLSNSSFFLMAYEFEDPCKVGMNKMMEKYEFQNMIKILILSCYNKVFKSKATKVQPFQH